MKFHRSSFVLLLLAASAGPAWPEQSAQPPTFRTRVDAVTVDVSATDSESARPDRPPLPSGMAGALASAAVPASGHAIRTWIGSDRADAGGQSTVTIVWEIGPDTSRVEPR